MQIHCRRVQRTIRQIQDNKLRWNESWGGWATYNYVRQLVMIVMVVSVLTNGSQTPEITVQLWTVIEYSKMPFSNPVLFL